MLEEELSLMKEKFEDNYEKQKMDCLNTNIKKLLRFDMVFKETSNRVDVFRKEKNSELFYLNTVIRADAQVKSV